MLLRGLPKTELVVYPQWRLVMYRALLGIIIKFLCNDSEKTAEIHSCLQLQFGEKRLSRFYVFQKWKFFKDGLEFMLNTLLGEIQFCLPLAVLTSRYLVWGVLKW